MMGTWEPPCVCSLFSSNLPVLESWKINFDCGSWLGGKVESDIVDIKRCFLVLDVLPFEMPIERSKEFFRAKSSIKLIPLREQRLVNVLRKSLISVFFYVL